MSDPLVSFEIPFLKDQFLAIYIWKNVPQLHQNTPFRVKDYTGCYLAFPERKVFHGKFGEIHLVKDYLGAGYVAHEIEHFILDWIETTLRVVGNRNQEKICYLCGDVTTEFWTKVYERMTLTPGPNTQSVKLPNLGVES